MALAHHDSGVPVHQRVQAQPGLEPLDRQWPQQRCFHREVLAHGARPVRDAPGVIGLVGGLQAGVELSQ